MEGEMVQFALVFGMHQNKFRAGPAKNSTRNFKNPQISLIKLVSWVSFFLTNLLGTQQLPRFFFCTFSRWIFVHYVHIQKPQQLQQNPTGFVSFLHQDWWVLSESSDSIPVKLKVGCGLTGWLKYTTWKGSMAQPLGCIGELDLAPY